MAKFKIIISDPETGKSQVVELEGTRAVPLVGRKLGETIDGATLGLGGHKVRITGGSDKDGFPMRPDIHGGVKARIVTTRGIGFHPTSKGERRRKTLRGNVITEEVVQINMVTVEKPKRAEKEQQPEVAAEKPQKAETSEAARTEKSEKPEKPKKSPKTAPEEIEEHAEAPREAETGGQTS